MQKNLMSDTSPGNVLPSNVFTSDGTQLEETLSSKVPLEFLRPTDFPPSPFDIGSINLNFLATPVQKILLLNFFVFPLVVIFWLVRVF